jgi:DNA primase
MTVAAALGLEVSGRKARCFNGAAHRSGKDEHPALVFFTDTNRFKCFACGVSGDAIALVQALRMVSFCEAIEFLRGLGGTGESRVPRDNDDHFHDRRTPDDQVKQVYASLYELSFESNPASPGGVYLQHRGIEVDLANRFYVSEMGNPTRVWSRLIALYGEDQLRAAGLMSRSGKFLFAHHSLLFFFTQEDWPQFVQARDITGQATCKELSVAGLHSPVPYNVDVLQQGHDRVLVCEGCIDTLSAVQLGHPAVGVPGVTGFRDEWFPLFRDIRRVTVLFDDEAGRRQAADLRARFRLRGIRADAQFPRCGKDVNDLLKSLAMEEHHDTR